MVDSPSGLEKMFENNGHIHAYTVPGQGHTAPCGQVIFINTII